MVIVESEMQWYELNTADCRWVAQNLEIMFRKFQFSTRRTRILMGFIIRTIHSVVLIVNPMRRILVG